MESVDTQRMRRVLARIRGTEEGAPAGSGNFDALAGEEAALGLMLFAARRSKMCDSALAEICRRCRRRGRELRAGRFLAGEDPGPRERPGREPPGVLSALRGLYIQLKALEDAYRAAGREDPAGECRADADAVRTLLSRALG